jgi:hypothetical protein
MGEKQDQPFQLSFNASLKADFQASGGTSDDRARGISAMTARSTRAGVSGRARHINLINIVCGSVV